MLSQSGGEIIEKMLKRATLLGLVWPWRSHCGERARTYYADIVCCSRLVGGAVSGEGRMATRPCRICGRLTETLPEREGRCPQCMMHWRRRGIERVGSP